MTTHDDLVDCLPVDLRAGATIEKIGAGLSGAGVYRVRRGEATYVLKVARSDEPLETWRNRAAIQRSAAEAGVAPRVLHVDEQHRAVVSEHVSDRGFPAYLMTPPTRQAAIELLANTLRRLHGLPVPPHMSESNPREALVELSSALSGFAVPSFVGEAVARIFALPEPPRARPLMLSHNDVNPSNLAFDGERLMLLDWDTAGINDPLFDLASISMFFRFDDATCAQLVSAYDEAPATELPARFRYLKRLVAALCGCALFAVARRSGHAGSTEGTLESAASLVDVYQRMRAGRLSPGTPEGQWQFALALIKAST